MSAAQMLRAQRDTPECLGKFKALRQDLRSYVALLIRRRMYKSYMAVIPQPILAGIPADVAHDGAYGRFGLASAILFFSDGALPTFDGLEDGRWISPVLVLEMRRDLHALSNRSRVYTEALLEPRELADWIRFFECRLVRDDRIERIR